MERAMLWIWKGYIRTVFCRSNSTGGFSVPAPPSLSPRLQLSWLSGKLMSHQTCDNSLGLSINNRQRCTPPFFWMHLCSFTSKQGPALSLVILPHYIRDRGQRGSYPAHHRLQHHGDVVLLQLEQLRGLAVHGEAVGVVVELHGAGEAAIPGHHVGQLQEKEKENRIHVFLRDFSRGKAVQGDKGGGNHTPSFIKEITPLSSSNWLKAEEERGCTLRWRNSNSSHREGHKNRAKHSRSVEFPTQPLKRCTAPSNSSRGQMVNYCNEHIIGSNRD